MENLEEALEPDIPPDFEIDYNYYQDILKENDDLNKICPFCFEKSLTLSQINPVFTSFILDPPHVLEPCPLDSLDALNKQDFRKNTEEFPLVSYFFCERCEAEIVFPRCDYEQFHNFFENISEKHQIYSFDYIFYLFIYLYIF